MNLTAAMALDAIAGQQMGTNVELLFVSLLSVT